MVIMSQIEFPPDQAKEIGRCFMKLPALPEYLTMNGPYIRASEDRRLKAITLYLCEPATLSEAYAYVNNRLTAYFIVPGFSYTCDIWLDATEGLKMVGLGEG